MRALSLAAILALGFLTTLPTFAQTTFVVTKTADTNDGTCDADCSLREAIEAADAAAGDDLIRFDLALDGQSIFPTSEYIINTNVEIDAVTGLSEGITIDAGLESFFVVQVFPPSGPPNTVSLAGLTLTRSQNGFLYNDGILTVDQCTFRDNTGGAIVNEGTLVVKNSTLSGNAASTIDRSTIFNQSGVVTVLNSTFSGNTTSSTSVAAAIQSNPSATVTVRNSTFSGNTHTLGQVSGISGGTVTVGNTVFESGSGANLGLGTIISEGFNICDDACGLTGTSDQTSTDPQLGPLADNGGPTLTHTLLTGSPAIDIGGTCGPEDQRGESAPVAGTFNGNAVCDAGAIEIATPPPPSMLVVNTADGGNDGICGADAFDPVQDCSLREAVAAANSNPDANTITFDPLGQGNIVLEADLVITTPITIDGVTGDGGTYTSQVTGNDVYGIVVTGAAASNSVIQGLVLGDAPVALRLDDGVSGVQVLGNFIGADSDGADSFFRNGTAGLVITGGSTNNTIGGTGGIPMSGASKGNVFGFSPKNLVLEGTGTTGNTVIGNFFSTNEDGDDLATDVIGISINGVAIRDGASNNTVGGTTSDERNVFGYLRGDGILIEDAGTTGNIVQGNFIGTDLDGFDYGLPSGSGIYIRNAASDNTIGGTAAGAGNTIGFNGGTGILIQFAGTTGNTVQGNFIGTNADGDNYGNRNGIWILGGASNNSIGGSAAGAANTIGHNTEQGLILQNTGTSNNTIQGNFIGTNAAGADLGNGAIGVRILFGPSNNTIGGSGAGEGNTIGFNVDGIQVANLGASPTGNQILGNYIGTNATGANLGNSRDGVSIGGNITNNTVGGTDPGAGNTIGFNAEHGIRIGFSNGIVSIDSDIVVQGNFVGTNAAGADLGNGIHGIFLVDDAQNNTIGGAASGAGNTVGFNGGSGIVISEAPTASNIVQGNFVGTNAAGANLGNTLRGILIAGGATNNTIGGANAGEGNTVGFNALNGIRLEGTGTNGNVVRGNFVGTDATGANRGNTGKGISVASGASNNTIGGTGAGEGNTVGFSSQDGIEVAGNGTTGNNVLGNFVGTNAAGDDLGNTNFGVTLVFGASNNTVGGAASGAENTIGFHGLAGIYINATSTDNTVLGNFVGTNAAGDDLGNDGNGVQIFNAPNNTIGGTGAHDGNTIANNGVGINVEGEPAVGNALLGNQVFDNSSLGIDLLPFGVAANDGCTDADVGPNGLQNFPVIAQVLADGGTTTIGYDLDTAAGDYRVEFFSVTTPDAIGNGEGHTFLGAQDATVTAGCGEAFQLVLPTQLATTLSITATATRINAGQASGFGGTSEFSAALGVTLAVGTIGDFVFNDRNGDGVQDAGEGGLESVTLFLDANGNDELDAGEQSATTDASGAYDLTDILAGTYTVTVDTTTVPEGFVLTTGNDPQTVVLASQEDFNDADFGFRFECAPGFFLDPDAPTNCLPAPPGTFVAMAGATEAEPCVPGTFQPLEGQTSCAPAPAGRFVAVERATEAEVCALGTYQPLEGQTSCLDADPGNFVPAEGAIAQSPCELGTFQPEAGQSMCLPAPVGSYVDIEEATSTTSCPAGTTTDVEGATSASDCVAITAQTFLVTKTDDTNDGTCDADCSLREAIAAADANLAAEADTVRFAPDVTGTINLNGADLTVASNVVVEGPGARVLTVSGGLSSTRTNRVFTIAGSAGDVRIHGLTIERGRTTGPSGAGILVSVNSTLTLAESVVKDNDANFGANGGGLFVEANGSLNLIRSLVAENTSSNDGGGIFNSGGTVVVSNSTVSGNTTVFGSNGGIYQASGSTTLDNATVTGNSGQAATSASGTFTVNTSIIAGNGSDTAGAFVSDGNNVIGNVGSATGFDSDLVADPLIGPLTNNGGPTSTHALLAGSPAIDIGGTCGPTDQRGFDAPIIGNPTNGTALCDAGSFETEILDAEPPTVVIATTLDDPTATQPIPLSFSFSEVVSGFAAEDINVTGGSLGPVSTPDSTTFAADLTPDSAGEITVDIAAGVATDLAGNPNEAADTFAITFDDEGPTGYTVAFDQNVINASTATAVSFTISEAGEGASFVYTITSDGGAGEVTGSGTIGASLRVPGGVNDLSAFRGNKGGGFLLTYSLTSEQVSNIDVSNLPDGILTLSVTLTDPLGNAGDEATNTVDKDSGAPTVTVTTVTPEPTVQSPFLVTITFSEAVVGFTADDIDVTNGTLTDFDDSGAPVYTVNVTPSTFGEVTVAVDGGVADDAAGNPNVAAAPLVRTYEERFDLALSTEIAFTGPGTGTLTALVTNTGSVLATRVRVKITKTFDVATGPKQLVIGAIAPGETGTAVFDFGSAGDNAEVRLKAEDLVVRDDEENFADNRAVVFLIPDDGGADLTPPEITGALSGQVFAGTAEENRINDTGVASVVLDPGSVNLTLVVDPFAAGATVVSYTATPIDPMLDATGTLRATDIEGNADTLPVIIPRTPPPPPTETLVVRLTPDDAPIFVGNGGGSFTFTGEVTNPTDGRLAQDVWLVLISPSDFEEVQFGPFRVRLDAGGMTSERFTVTVDREAEAGVYAYEGRVGTFPSEVTNTDRFTFEKLGDGSRVAEPLALGRMAHAVTSDARRVLPVLSTTAGLVWGVTDDDAWAALEAEKSSARSAEDKAKPERSPETSATSDAGESQEPSEATATDSDLSPSNEDASRTRDSAGATESTDAPEDAPEMEADEIDSDEIDSDEIDSDEIDSDEIDSDEIDSDEIDSDEIETDGVELPVVTESTALPDAYALEAVYPNPLRDRATLQLALPEATKVNVTLFDLRGRTMAVLAAQTYEAGVHDVAFDASALPSGVYLIRVTSAAFMETQKVTIVR